MAYTLLIEGVAGADHIPKDLFCSAVAIVLPQHPLWLAELFRNLQDFLHQAGVEVSRDNASNA